MVRAISIIVSIASVCVIIAVISAGYFFNQFFLISPDEAAAGQEFVISSGESAAQISDRLDEAGIIKSDFIFNTHVWFMGHESDFKIGEFTLKPGMSMMTICNTLTLAEATETWVTIIEGWNLRDAAFKFEEMGMFQAEEIFEQAGQPGVDYRPLSQKNPAEAWKAEFDFLGDKPGYVSLEGYLFPDTYKFYKDATAEDAVRRLLINFDKKLEPEWREEIARQGKSVFEVITMASIIEKEMSGLEARKMVSDIFWKRLDMGMPLQSDASVNYVTGKKTTRPSIEDTQVDSPYNTYKYPGLPLGPISNPGAEAIEAAIYPTTNDYYYFLNTEDGDIIYSKTHDEHVENKAKYLK
ncbi:endolytic transglycosylase MltG [Patescibacteria group bacterium]|nr:endolytic transglycosylase MltG [Patescibacteria group bacterium]MBU1922304.1 endolytic transglycosylase MltG [Patescibacteria group bacterium]